MSTNDPHAILHGSSPVPLSNVPGTQLDLFVQSVAGAGSEPSGLVERLYEKGWGAQTASDSAQVSQAGKKLDTGKAPVAQACLAYFPRAIEAVATVSQYGREKYNVAYADKNWMRVDNAEGLYEDALARHSLKHLSGEEGYDPESKLLHAAHRAWNALATLELLLAYGEVLVRSSK